MDNYLIILQKKGKYHGNEYETLWLPTTEDEIDRALHNLGCRSVLPDYQIIYANFGCPEIDKLAYNSTITALNRMAILLQDFRDKPKVLSAELVFMECKDIYDVIAHLENRPKLVFVEDLTDIAEAGEWSYADRFYESPLAKKMTFKEYKDMLYYDDCSSLNSRFIIRAMECLCSYKFRFTQYGLVYQEEIEAPKSLDDIELPF